LEYLLITIAVLILIGSISIAIPSKASRKISRIRMDAKLLGCKISSNLYGENKFKNSSKFSVSYSIKNHTNLKEAHFIRDKTELILYSPVKLKYSDRFKDLKKALQNISVSLEEIIFTSASISFLWRELEGIEELKKIIKNFDELKKF
tara:strand:+ start:2202 stop:2645 length:444 start_codon:yes stop_codon:yes gene_type:complete